MNLIVEGRRLARSQLEVGVSVLEAAAARGSHHPMYVRNVGEAAGLLGHGDLVARASRLLYDAPDDAFFSGMIANFDPTGAINRLRVISSPGEAARRFPEYCESRVMAGMCDFAKTEPGIALCLDGRFEEAIARGSNAWEIDLTASTLAVIGRFEEARRCGDRLATGHRKQGFLLVLSIELFRRGRFDESAAAAAEADIPADPRHTWFRVDLAVGYSGREPWPGYPYPDW